MCYFGEAQQNILNVPATNKEEHFQSDLSNWLWHYNYNDSANTISTFNLFRIECFDSGVCYFGKFCWMFQQGTEKSIIKVIFRIGFGIMTAMILQNTISRFNLFQIESLDSWVLLRRATKKNLLNVWARNREEHY